MFFFLRLCSAAPAPLSSGLACCLNAARPNASDSKIERKERKESQMPECLFFFLLLQRPVSMRCHSQSSVSRFFINSAAAPRRRSDAVQWRVVLNETPGFAEISYFSLLSCFFCLTAHSFPPTGSRLNNYLTFFLPFLFLFLSSAH